MSSSVLSGKTALITGASKGIGRATALALARLGANVVVNYSRDDAAANEIVKHIVSGSPDAKPPRAVAIKADSGDVSQLDTMIQEVVRVYGQIDMLIPNAATATMVDIEHLTEALYEDVMRLNVKGPLFLAQKCVAHMPAGSSITFLSTTLTAVSTISPAYLLYCASKGSVEQLVRVLARDLARKSIRVNAVAPGPTDTDSFHSGKSAELVKMIAAANPNNRIGQPEEVADVIAYLSGEGAAWVTGQVLRVNGGMA